MKLFFIFIKFSLGFLFLSCTTKPAKNEIRADTSVRAPQSDSAPSYQPTLIPAEQRPPTQTVPYENTSHNYPTEPQDIACKDYEKDEASTATI